MTARYFLWGDFMLKKYFWAASAISVFICGYVVHIGYEISNHAAWSLLVSSVNSSAWELTKPFALVYILFVFIELSYMRPSLLHFVCAKILLLHGFALMSVILLGISRNFLIYPTIFLSLLTAEFLSYKLYYSKCRIELFFIPIFISFAVFFFTLLFASVYPPPFFPFTQP